MKYLKGKLGLGIIVVAFIVVGYKNYIRKIPLKQHGITTKGVIINEETYMKNSHFYKPEDRPHKYNFSINGIIYEGDAQTSKYKIGDSILVRYLTNNPAINNPEFIYQD